MFAQALDQTRELSVSFISLYRQPTTAAHTAETFYCRLPYLGHRTRARTLCCFGLFFSSFEHAKNLLIMGPNNTKNSSLKCDFLIINYE